MVACSFSFVLGEEGFELTEIRLDGDTIVSHNGKICKM